LEPPVDHKPVPAPGQRVQRAGSAPTKIRRPKGQDSEMKIQENYKQDHQQVVVQFAVAAVKGDLEEVQCH